ncbi:mitochondrial import receptor subunit OR translocase-domain-containing protein [Chaetomium fimeti]|uniref:Mitochondrial import receptor subunit OR translocase-domain-containing protein n=1 Tax=Chaetomium fimeti TaxID=1854472 RepID=A0AAE0H5K1_9PEZI|nr:mitochondrial import receptor subunit OR translocase-domain-containing protein [Chaetomium fimeti]
MFGGFQPPQASPEELLAAEAEATFTLQRVLAAAAALYFCMPSTVLPTASPPDANMAHSPLRRRRRLQDVLDTTSTEAQPSRHRFVTHQDFASRFTT